MADLLEPKVFEIKDQKGNSRPYILSKFPAVPGRDITTNYTISTIPKIGEYATNERIMFKMMNYVAVDINGLNIRLATPDLIDNHIPDWETLRRVEFALMDYNCSFFLKDAISTFLNAVGTKIPAWTTKILTDSLGRLSTAEKPPTTN